MNTKQASNMVEILHRTIDKQILFEKHYKTDKKLVLRQRYNHFAIPSTNLDEDIINEIKKTNPKSVLDAGCGNGDFLIDLRKSGFSGELTGIDISKGITQKGEKQSAKNKLNINFITMDAENMLFENNSFDVIIAKHMLYHLPNPQKGIDEMHRCLKNNGILIITLNSKDNTPMLHECENLICKKYNLTSKHGQMIINVEDVNKLLEKFVIEKITQKEGKINKPELFPQVFESFIDNYSPQPNKELWAKIIADVNKFVELKIKTNNEFIETRKNGIIIARKAGF